MHCDLRPVRLVKSCLSSQHGRTETVLSCFCMSNMLLSEAVDLRPAAELVNFVATLFTASEST